jgi:hypothetical protein
MMPAAVIAVTVSMVAAIWPVVARAVVGLARVAVATAVMIGIDAGHDDDTRIWAMGVSVRVRSGHARGVVERVVAAGITVGIDRATPVPIVTGYVRRVRRAISAAARPVIRQLVAFLTRTAGDRGENRGDEQGSEQVSLHVLATRRRGFTS